MSDGSTSSSQLQRGLILLQQGRYQDAEKYFLDVLSSQPHHAFALEQLTICQLHHDHRHQEALRTIEHAIEIDPEDASLWATKAHVLLVNDQIEASLKTSQKALELDPTSASALHAQSGAYLQLQKWAEAEKTARHALEYDADDTIAANHLATALRLQNKIAENTDQIRSMLARDPEDAYTHANAGWSALQQGDRKTAETHFLESLRLDPEFEFARQGLLEAFKARSPVYRAYLQYCFSMQRLSRHSQQAIIIGLVVGVNFAKVLFQGPWRPLAILMGFTYFCFVMWVHVAQGVGNFLLLTDRFARHALRKREKIEGWCVGGGIFLGIVCLLFSYTLSSEILLILGGCLIGGAFPLAHVFTNDSKRGRILFSSFAAGVWIAGLTAILHSLKVPGIEWATVSLLTGLALLGIIATTWLANIQALKK